tara:strand:- start:34453 stop:35583 length:1131 start_codon:yes stop_codon:yes gene_type:complete
LTSEFRNIRPAYGFDEVSIVPGQITVNPDLVSTNLSIGNINISVPIIASAMDAVSSPSFMKCIDELGGLAVMNLEGVQSRYVDPTDALNRIVNAGPDDSTTVLQDVYSVPINENLLSDRIQEIKKLGINCVVSVTPLNAKKLSQIAVEAGADVIVVQSTVTTARHSSKSITGLVFDDLIKKLAVPVVVGNCVTYDAALELLETGISGLIVGVGPGAACTTREVTGVGVPQVTATIDCAAARDKYFKEYGRYVPIITDGGIRTGGDLCKAVVSGADAVMIGTPLVQSQEAPGKGYNWGMASPHPDLPRGVRVEVGITAPLKQILFGPTSMNNGTQNFVGALKTCMGMVGASNIKEMHSAELVLAPSIKTEGKFFQLR